MFVRAVEAPLRVGTDLVIPFLRWAVRLSSALALTVFLLIHTVGKGLASAYGSGSEDILRASAALAIPILLGAMLGSTLLPNARAFLHVIAAVVIVAVAGCLTLLRSNPGEAMIYIGFFVVWLCYYAALMRSGR
jgi:hypothetical protein